MKMSKIINRIMESKIFKKQMMSLRLEILILRKEQIKELFSESFLGHYG
jgi:hypothetical protein